MPPSTQFNESVARYILDNFEDRKMVIVSSNIEDDLIANLVADQTDSSRILQLTLEELRDYPFYETEKYIVYATPTKKSDVTSLIDIILTAKEESPLTEIAVIGRPSWVTIADGLRKSCSKPTYIFLPVSISIWKTLTAKTSLPTTRGYSGILH